MDVATRLIALDRRNEARRLVDTALAASKTVDAADPRLSTTRRAIGNLARLDLKAALALVPDRGDERTINDFRGLIAQEVADTDPAEAERLIGQMTWNSSETYVVKACRRMAPVDLPRAMAWFALAAERNDTQYVYAKQLLYANLTPAQFDEANAIWRELLPTYGDATALVRAKARWREVLMSATGSRVGSAAPHLVVGGTTGRNSHESPINYDVGTGGRKGSEYR